MYVLPHILFTTDFYIDIIRKRDEKPNDSDDATLRVLPGLH
jgi:hypothetical protein